MSLLKSKIPKYSGLQKQVLSLYRQFWRAASKKENPTLLRKYIRKEFDTYRVIPKHETMRIEWFLRNGHNKLEVLQSEHCINITFFY